MNQTRVEIKTGAFWGIIYVLFGLSFFIPLALPAQIILEDSIQFEETDRQGFLNQLIQPLRFRENRIKQDRQRVLNLIKTLSEKGDLRVDSTEINNITDQLMKMAADLSQSLEENKVLQQEIDDATSAINSKAPKNLIDSIQNQLGSVLQGLVDESKKESLDQRKEILQKLNDIKRVQFKCGTGRANTEEVQINDSTLVTIETCLKPKNKVFGWHHAWVGDLYKNYNFNYLTDLIYYGYELGPDGKNKNPMAMNTILDGQLARLSASNNVNLSLSLYTKSITETSRFLRSSDALLELEGQLKDIMQRVPLKGLNIYFEDLAVRDKDHFSEFIGRIKNVLAEIDPDFIITLVIPGLSSLEDRELSNAYDFVNLDKWVDFYMVETHKLKTNSSSNPGSPSPLFSPDGQAVGSIEATLGFYTNGKIPPGKLVVILSYFGIIWPVKGFLEESQALGRGEYIEFGHVQDKFRTEMDMPEPPVYGFDPEQVSSYYNFYENGQAKEVWFEDGKSLFQKYNFAMDQSLGGVAIWGLGYDDGYTDLWDALGAALVDVVSDTTSTKVIPQEIEKGEYSFIDYLKIYYDDMQWAAINDIYIDKVGEGDDHYCEYKIYKRDLLDSLIVHYKIDGFWNYRTNYQSNLDPYDNYLESETECVCLIERWNFYTEIHGFISLTLMAVLLILVLIIFLNLKKFGDDWGLRGLFTLMSFIVGLLLLVSFFLQLFFNGHFTLFGVGSEEVPVWVLVVILLFGVLVGIFVNRLHMNRKYEYKDLP